MLLLLRNHSEAFRHRKCLIPLAPPCDYSWHGTTPGPQRSWAESRRLLLARDYSWPVTPAYGSPTGAASPVINRLFGRKLPLSCVSVSARISYSNWEHSSRCVKESPPQFQVANFSFAPTRTCLSCAMA